MDDSAVREIERTTRTAQWKDKIEIQLDNRQVFFLFFGSAVVACMLFVLGVIVGKRIESRGRAEAPDVQDPLAVLDRAGQRAAEVGALAVPGELTFPKTLIAPSPSPKPKATPVAAKPAPVAAKPAPVAARPAPALAPVPAPSKPIAAAPKPAPALKPAAPKPAPVAAAPLDPAKAPKGKFTLHLATLQTKEDADTLARKYPGAFVISGDVPGKGLQYRVRLGNYATYAEVTAAKAAFEKQNRAVAWIAAR